MAGFQGFFKGNLIFRITIPPHKVPLPPFLLLSLSYIKKSAHKNPYKLLGITQYL
jgi:hypothetical protein